MTTRSRDILGPRTLSARRNYAELAILLQAEKIIICTASMTVLSLAVYYPTIAAAQVQGTIYSNFTLLMDEKGQMDFFQAHTHCSWP